MRCATAVCRALLVSSACQGCSGGGASRLQWRPRASGRVAAWPRGVTVALGTLNPVIAVQIRARPCSHVAQQREDTARPPDTLTRCNCEMRRRERLIVHHLSGWRASKVQCRHFARAVVLQICCCSLASARKRARHQPQAAKQCRITLIMGAEGTTKCQAAHRTCVNAAVLEQTGPDANAKHARAFLCMMCARMGQRVVRAARQNLLELGCSGN